MRQAVGQSVGRAESPEPPFSDVDEKLNACDGRRAWRERRQFGARKNFIDKKMR